MDTHEMGTHSVVGFEVDGEVICQNDQTGERYACGESLREYGLHNLYDSERMQILLPAKIS